MMAMQFLPTRVGQNASGDISAEIAKAVNDPASYFTTQKDKDAFEAAYADGITKLVDNAKGWTPDVVAKMTKEDKAARSELVGKSIERTTNREKHFTSMVTTAIEAGRNVPAGEKKRAAKASGGDEGLDLTQL